MIDRETPLASVLVDNGEGGAVDNILDTKSLADGLDEGGLAGSHLAVEGKDVALKVRFRDVLYEFPGDLVNFFKAADFKSLQYVVAFCHSVFL